MQKIINFSITNNKLQAKDFINALVFRINKVAKTNKITNIKVYNSEDELVEDGMSGYDENKLQAKIIYE